MALDLSGQTPPTPRTNPRRSSAGSSGKEAQRAKAQKTEAREEGVKGLFQLAAFGSIMFGGRTGLADAGACAIHGEPISREVAALAETSEPLARAVDFVCAVGPFAGILAASMPFALQILLNHGRIPNVPQLAQFGVLPPELMEAQARMEAERQQAELARQLQEQQAAIARMQAEPAA